MSKSTKIFLIGFIISLISILVGLGSYIKESHDIAGKVISCEKEMSSVEKGPWLDFQEAPLVCDPHKLYIASRSNLKSDIQVELRDLYDSKGNFFYICALLSGLILLTSLIPHAWYFLLRRIKELADAFRR